MAVAPDKFLTFFQETSPLADAFRDIWDARIVRVGDDFDVGHDVLRQLGEACWAALVENAHSVPGSTNRSRSPVGWVAPFRQELSLEGISRVVFLLDHALREALWKLGLSAPDWQALVAWQAQFFEQVMDALVDWGRSTHRQQLQLRQEVAFFRQLARVLETPSDRNDALAVAVKETARVLNCEFSAILLPGETEQGMLQVAAVEAPPLMAQAVKGMSFPVNGSGIVAQVYLSGAPASSNHPSVELDLSLRRRQTLEGLGFSDMLAYPLSLHGGVVGVLCLASRAHDRPWQAYEDDWLAAIATQLALAIKAIESRKAFQNAQSEAQMWVMTMLSMAEPLLRDHSERVARAARLLGSRLGLPTRQLLELEQAGFMHDIGQLFLPDVMRRRPGPLWPEELELLRQHPTMGAALVDNIRVLRHLVPAIKHHHEHWDGSGYPDGLSEDRIPLIARIVAVADAYVKATTPQLHQSALSLAEIRQNLLSDAGKKYDPMVVQALFLDDGALPLPVDGEPGRPPGFAQEELPPVLPALASRLIATVHQVADLQAGLHFTSAFWATLSDLCAHDAVLLWRRNAEGGLFLAEAHGVAVPPGYLEAQVDALEVYAALCRVPAGATDLGSDPRFKAPKWLLAKGMNAAVALPLLVAERVLGVLTLYRKTRAPFLGQELLLAELAATLAAHALAHPASQGAPDSQGG